MNKERRLVERRGKAIRLFDFSSTGCDPELPAARSEGERIAGRWRRGKGEERG